MESPSILARRLSTPRRSYGHADHGHADHGHADRGADDTDDGLDDHQSRNPPERHSMHRSTSGSQSRGAHRSPCEEERWNGSPERRTSASRRSSRRDQSRERRSKPRDSRRRSYRSIERSSWQSRGIDESSNFGNQRKRTRHDSGHDCGNPEPKRGRHRQEFENSLIDTFIDAIKSIKSNPSEKLSSLQNVIPEFDPMIKEQTIDKWLSKVDECKSIYEWNEKQVIHYALPKLTGISKTWYQSLSTLMYTWDEWKIKLMESFPSSQNYGELLTEMLDNKLRFGESPELYYYSKINLLNRCKIQGTNAIDCMIYGIEDRGIRVGAQAARFTEPEQLLKFFKTIKPNVIKESSRKDREKRPLIGTKGTNKTNPAEFKSIICFNCNESGHPSFKCPKPIKKCSRCNLIGHLAETCPKTVGLQKNKEKAVLNVASQISSSIYTFPISVNGTDIQCHLDLGSECTLIRLSDALRIGISWSSNIDLPMLKGLGNIPYQPIGCTAVDIGVQGIVESKVDVLIVDDHLINYPVLLGHTFSERPGIEIIKTTESLIVRKTMQLKVHLTCNVESCLAPGDIRPIQIKSEPEFTGTISVSGGIRGNNGSEFYMFPGEYDLRNGTGYLLIHNLTSKDLKLRANQLLSRGKSVAGGKYIYDVKLSDSHDKFEPVIGENASEDQTQAVKDLLLKYKECFSFSLKDLGFTTVVEMDINLNNTDPVVYRPYRLPYCEREEVQRMVAEMLECGIIKESSSPYASPIVIVKKKSGEKRLCVDYRALNNRTKREHYPLPRVEELLDRLAGHNTFISLDLASGYYQIPIAAESQEKTAFVTQDGQYQYTRMPFGLANAPSVFQRAMHKILDKGKVGYVIVYMDDVLIPARSFDEAIERLDEVLNLLKEGGLTLKLQKCKFMFDKLDFLGFEISSEGIKPGSLKTEAVSKFPTPANQHDIRRFIGLASFFRRFVKGFAVLASPLTALLRKGVEWTWGCTESKAFNEIKEHLTKRPILALYDKSRETQLHTDASKLGVAGILLQKDDSGSWRAVAYYSRQTSPEEQKLHSFELETLAVIASLNKFRVYLLGLRFKIITDCNSLRTTLTKRDLVPKIARWWIQLQEFDCEFEYRPGGKMAHVDALSRAPVEVEKPAIELIDVLTISEEDWITTVQSSDDEIVRIKAVLSDPETAKILDIQQNYKLKNSRVYRIVAEGILRWVVPRGSRWQIVKANHDDVGHFGIEKTLDRIRALYWFPKMRSFVTKYVSACLKCAHHKIPPSARQGHLHAIEKVEIPFHTIHADHVGPFNKSKKKNSYILVMIDAFTKFVTLAAVRSTKSSETITALKNLIGCFGTPTRLITDRGSCFTSKKFKGFTEDLGIKHVLNAVSTPRANGQVERSNRTILAALSTMTHDKDPRMWDRYLPDVQLGINTTIHDVTKKTPSELLFGRRVTNPSQGILNEIISDTGDGIIEGTIEDVRANASTLMQEQSKISTERYNRGRSTAKRYKERDLVRVVRAVAPGDGKSKKLESKVQGPYKVIKVLPNDRYVVEDTPLTRKGRRYEAIIAADKMYPWLSFRADSESDDDNGPNADSEHDNGNVNEITP